MDDNPYEPPQTRCSPTAACAKLLPLLLPTLFALLAYAVFNIAWDTPLPVIGR